MRPKRPVWPLAIALLTDSFRRIDDNRNREAVVFPRGLDKPLPILGADVGGVYDRQLSTREPLLQHIVKSVESIVRGKAESIRMALCCLLTEGHLLIDDVPGTGKTSMAKAIAGSIDRSQRVRHVK